MDDSTNIRIKRLLYRSNNRGCKETDILMGGFASGYIEEFSQIELDEYELILDESDSDIFNWIAGKVPVPDRLKTNSVLGRLLNFKLNIYIK